MSRPVLFLVPYGTYIAIIFRNKGAPHNARSSIVAYSSARLFGLIAMLENHPCNSSNMQFQMQSKGAFISRYTAIRHLSVAMRYSL
jgi:hypothetical protein